MASRHTISIRDDSIEEYLERLYEEGPYRNRSHAIEEVLKKHRDRDVEDILV